MSGKMVGWVWELDLPYQQQLVLLALADNAHHDGTRCFPGVALLAWKTGYSPRNIQRILRDLESEGLIEAVAHPNGGRGRATEYALRLDAGARKDPLPRPRKGDDLSRANGVGLSPNRGGKRATDPLVKGDTQMSPQRKEPSVKPSMGSSRVMERGEMASSTPGRSDGRGREVPSPDFREGLVGAA